MNDTNQYLNSITASKMIEFEKFYSEDFALIFDENLVKRLSDKTKLKYHNFDSNHEISILTMDPNSLHEGFEGSQLAFEFCNTDQGYKFCGINGIP